jgi:chloride channel protein, CIC family
VKTSARRPDIAEELGDFTTTPRVLLISAFAIGIGLIGAYVALALLKLIGFFTNLLFFQRIGTALVSPAGHTLGPWVILVPVAGALVIGVMARYGSERIRGHGIPEAIEGILINGSRIDPKVALLKPLSSAISIGSGGPFGAEGPIIMTGGAVGSLIAQFFHLTSTERKTLLVAGAAAGMSATFAAPLASVLLAVELLLFEWKPRSLIPVALASATAAATRRYIIGMGPLFPVPAHPAFIGPQGLLGCILAGLLAGVLSALLTQAVYASEDAFQHLPIHWMWWPAIGGLVIGVGGWLFPQALGVGYDVIEDLLRGDVPGRVILGILIV